MWSEHCSYKSSKHPPRQVPDRGALGGLRPGRERRRGRHRRRPGRRLQDGEPQPPLASSSPTRVRRPASAASCATCSPWVRGRWRCSTRCASATRRTPRPATCSSGVVAGIGGYGNCVGVPTVGGECTFHRAYNGNILVNAMCVGIARADRVFYAKASGVGNPGGLCRRQDRARRHPRRHHGLGRVQRRRPRPSGRPSRSATRSPRSC